MDKNSNWAVYHTRVKISTYTSALVLTRVMIDRERVVMAGLFKYFQLQSLPENKETGLREAITKEANAAVERLMEEERNGRKQKYVQFAPEHGQR